jgi:hypothetical protein
MNRETEKIIDLIIRLTEAGAHFEADIKTIKMIAVTCLESGCGSSGIASELISIAIRRVDWIAVKDALNGYKGNGNGNG